MRGSLCLSTLIPEALIQMLHVLALRSQYRIELKISTVPIAMSAEANADSLRSGFQVSHYLLASPQCVDGSSWAST